MGEGDEVAMVGFGEKRQLKKREEDEDGDLVHMGLILEWS